MTAASFLLADRGFDGLFSATVFNTPLGLFLLALGPLSFLVLGGFLLYGIVSFSLHTGQSTRFGSRLFVLMIALILCSSVPSSVIVCRFTARALGSWYEKQVPESLGYAVEMAELYEAERVRDIEKVASRFLNGLSINNYILRHNDWMNDIRAIDAYAVACQIYRMEGSSRAVPVMENGDSSRFLPRDRLDLVEDGFFEYDVGGPLYRYGQTVHYNGNVYVCVYSSMIPDGMGEKSDLMHAANEQARIVGTLDPYLPFMGLWIFLLFCLPPALMAAIMAYYFSFRESAPLAVVKEAAARISGGDRSPRVITHAKDELASIAASLNAIAGQAKAVGPAKQGPAQPAGPGATGATGATGAAGATGATGGTAGKIPPEGRGGIPKDGDKKARLRL